MPKVSAHQRRKRLSPNLTTLVCDVAFKRNIRQPGKRSMSQPQFPSVPQILKSSTGLTCRVHERRQCDLPSTCQPTSAWGRKDARWRATIHDISVTGVSLLVARRFEPGAGLAVELPATE